MHEQDIGHRRALRELGSDQVAFGHGIATVRVLDMDATAADEKLRRMEFANQGLGFMSIP